MIGKERERIEHTTYEHRSYTATSVYLPTYLVVVVVVVVVVVAAVVVVVVNRLYTL